MAKCSSLLSPPLRTAYPSFPFRSRYVFHESLKIILSYISSRTSDHLVGLLFVTIVLAYLVIISVSSLLLRGHFSSFDDIEDMRLLAEEEAEFVRQKRNESSIALADPLRLYNATNIIESRKKFDYIYGEITRSPNPLIFTKYKKRLLRELFARTHYKRVNKYSATVDVSCNYLNDLSDEKSLHTFKCSDTSHRCLDGRFSLQSTFDPAEGTSVTWKEIVIVLLVSAEREPFLEAAAETWISRLHAEATLFFAKDGQEPSLPLSIVNRPNTNVYSYPGLVGLQYLDVKALETWNKVYEKFALSGKKYFLKIDDDSFLFGHNFIRFLNKVEHWFSGREQALYFGHPFCGHGDLAALGYEKWCYAGGGAYGLSIEALQIMLTQIKDGCDYFYDYVIKGDGRPVEDGYGGRYEDVMIGRCLRQARTRTQVRGTSLLACGSFFPYAPLHYYEKFGQSKETMCKKLNGDPITIHNLEPSAIRYMDHIAFEYPLGGDASPFSPNNERMDELIKVCRMNKKKMFCDLSKVLSF